MNVRFVYELSRSTSKSCSLRGGNELISANDRLNPHVKAELTAHLRKLSTEIAFRTYEDPKRIMFSEENPCYIGVIVCAPTKRRMDAPNWYPTIKALIDGLTDAGVFEDDNNKIITSTTFVPGPISGTKKYKFIIDIKEGVDKSWLT